MGALSTPDAISSTSGPVGGGASASADADADADADDADDDDDDDDDEDEDDDDDDDVAAAAEEEVALMAAAGASLSRPTKRPSVLQACLPRAPRPGAALAGAALTCTVRGR